MENSKTAVATTKQKDFCALLKLVEEMPQASNAEKAAARASLVLPITLKAALKGKMIENQPDKASTRAILSLLQFVEESLSTKPLTSIQIATIVKLIKADYRFLRTEEIAIAFKNAVKGNYGKHYHQLDVQIIASWLEQYIDGERLDHFENKAYQIKAAEKSDKTDFAAIAAENAKKIFDEIGDGYEKNRGMRAFIKSEMLHQRIKEDNEKMRGNG